MSYPNSKFRRGRVQGGELHQQSLVAVKSVFLKVMKILRIGNIFGATGGSFAGNIYRSDGLCPTINTAGGGTENL